jgi:hypothetical protein
MSTRRQFETFLADVEIAVARASTSMRQVDIPDDGTDAGPRAEPRRQVARHRRPRRIMQAGQRHGHAARQARGRPDDDHRRQARHGQVDARRFRRVLVTRSTGTRPVRAVRIQRRNVQPQADADLLHAAGRPILFKTIKEGILSREERPISPAPARSGQMLPIKWAHVGRTDVKRLEAIVARESAR